MAEGSALDGFTIMNVGDYDDAEWKRHHATQGEELPDEQGAGGGGAPAVAVGVNCTIANNIVHHNGNVGIAVQGRKGKTVSPRVSRNVVYRNMGGGIGSADGSTATIEENICYQNLRGGIGNRNASPLIVNNECFENVRAGIGIREGACPIVRGNKCYKNRRAGIGIRMKGTNPIVEGNECHENDMAGIGCRDHAAPIVRGNRCSKNRMAGIGARDHARPVIEDNECHQNEMAGIGCRLGAAPIIRNNRCYRNLMAGIGSRDRAAPIIRDNRCYKNEMAGIGSRLGAKPVIVGNECFENQMAGIGTREGASALIHDNRCYKNKDAGIGSRDGAKSLIVGNECRENQMAGIGAHHQAHVTILNNRCIDNGKVAIGLRHGTTAHVAGNELERKGGMPPMIAVGEASSAVIAGNTIRGGGVTGILVEGVARIVGNDMQGQEKSGSAVWALPKSDVLIAGNRVDRYRNLVANTGCKISVIDNRIGNFQGTAISVKNALAPAHVWGNVAVSKTPKAVPAVVEGPRGAVADNVLKEPEAKDLPKEAIAMSWPAAGGKVEWKAPEKKGERTVQDGPWKLVATEGRATRYQLFNLTDDPQQKKDLSGRLEHVLFRLIGLLERQEAKDFKAEGAGPGQRK
jgi:parallel beta-helix repeat protein